MMIKKRGLLIAIFSALIVFSIIGVSASFWSKITGKDVFTRDVSLTVEAAPEIVYISDIIGGDRSLTVDGVAQKTFEFYVYHTGGVKVLPGGAEPESDPIDNTNVILTLKFQATPYPQDMRKSSDVGLCTYAGDDLAYNTNIDEFDEVNINTVAVRKYSCIVEMQYYDDFGSPINMNWDVKPYVKDTFGKAEGYDPNTDITTQNAYAQPNRDTYFNTLDGSVVDGAAILQFGTIDYTTSNRQPTEAVGVYPLVARNTGNRDLTPITLTAYNIPGVTIPTEFILASWFRSDDEATVCTLGNALADSAAIESGLSPINDASDASPTSQKDLRICLTSITTAASPQTYSTAGGNSWVIDITYA